MQIENLRRIGRETPARQGVSEHPAERLVQ
jgi:hypothetical protein